MAETVAGRATPTARTEGAVLLVDADPNVAELLTTTLVVQGFQVYTAADGPAAVERARAVRPDAVILEVTLPGVEDFELLGRLRVEAPARNENSAARVREAGAAPVVWRCPIGSSPVCRISIRRSHPLGAGGQR